MEEALPEPGERASLVAEDVHGDRPAAADLAHDPVAPDDHVVEGHLGQLVGAVGPFDGPYLDARVAEVDHHGREAAVS